MENKLIMFTGTECFHCKQMHPLIDRLEKEEGVKVEKMEIWHNAENASFMEKVDTEPDGSRFCRSIPMFYNEKTGKRLCGNQENEKLKEWAKGN